MASNNSEHIPLLPLTTTNTNDTNSEISIRIDIEKDRHNSIGTNSDSADRTDSDPSIILDEDTENNLHILIQNREEDQFIQCAQIFQPLTLDFIDKYLEPALEYVLARIVKFLLNQNSITGEHKIFILYIIEYIGTDNESRLLNILSEIYTAEDVTDILQYYLKNVDNLSHKKCFVVLCEKRREDITVDRWEVTFDDKLYFFLVAARAYDDALLELLTFVYTTEDVNELSIYFLRKYENFYHKKCYDILWKQRNDDIDVNWKGLKGAYQLHHAAKLSDPDMVLRLLKNGASLANKSIDGDLTIENIHYTILKDHFDSCIEDNGDLNEDDSIICYDYKILLPTSELNDSNKSETVNNQMKAVLFIAETKALKQLLLHPLIFSFICIKFKPFKSLLYLNVAMRFCYFNLMMIYLKFSKILISTIFAQILLVCNTYFFISEIFQMILLRKKYFSKFENYIELAAFGLYFYILYSQSTSCDSRSLIGLVIALSVFYSYSSFSQFLLYSTSHFKPNWIFLYINMLATIIQNCLKVFLVYFYLIMFLFVAFLVIFGDVNFDCKIANDNNNSAIDDQKNLFDDEGLSFIYLITMLTGNYALENINLTKDYIRYIYFILFIICFATPFMNMLNGLAVSDIQTIKKEATLTPLITRVQYLSTLEILFSYKNVRTEKILKFFNIDIPKIANIIRNMKLEIFSNGQINDGNKELKQIGINSLPSLVVKETQEILRNKKINQMNEIKQEKIENALTEIYKEVREIKRVTNVLTNVLMQMINTKNHNQRISQMNRRDRRKTR